MIQMMMLCVMVAPKFQYSYTEGSNATIRCVVGFCVGIIVTSQVTTQHFVVVRHCCQRKHKELNIHLIFN